MIEELDYDSLERLQRTMLDALKEKQNDIYWINESLAEIAKEIQKRKDLDEDLPINIFTEEIQV